MAKFKKRKGRKARNNFFSKRKAQRKSSNGTGALIGTIAGGAIYGIGREYANSALAPITAKVPLGKYADNVVLGAVSYFLAKGKIPLLNKIPMSKEIGKAGLVIESAMLGQDLAGGLGLTASNSSTRSESW
jgi:hypothetical protein